MLSETTPDKRQGNKQLPVFHLLLSLVIFWYLLQRSEQLEQKHICCLSQQVKRAQTCRLHRRKSNGNQTSFTLFWCSAENVWGSQMITPADLSNNRPRWMAPGVISLQQTGNTACALFCVSFQTFTPTINILSLKHVKILTSHTAKGENCDPELQNNKLVWIKTAGIFYCLYSRALINQVVIECCSLTTKQGKWATHPGR